MRRARRSSRWRVLPEPRGTGSGGTSSLRRGRVRLAVVPLFGRNVGSRRRFSAHSVEVVMLRAPRERGQRDQEGSPMFPVGDDNSGRRTVPLVTYALIALNLLFFFV